MSTTASPAWIADLRRDGFAVVKGAGPRERADAYASAALDWAESFPGLGFKRDDPATWDADHLPIHYPGGLYVGYAVAHERFAWEARQ